MSDGTPVRSSASEPVQQRLLAAPRDQKLLQSEAFGVGSDLRCDVRQDAKGEKAVRVHRYLGELVVGEGPVRR